MKYLVFSDLHGSGIYAEKIIEKFNNNKCDKMLCLGDILYHGPRNDLPEGYNPKRVISILNPYKDVIIAVKGNCDAYVDQMVLDFDILDDYEFNYNNKTLVLTHGHFVNPDSPMDRSNIVVLYGHTHVYKKDIVNNSLYLNPGSTTIPKNGTLNSYAIIDDNKFIVYDFNDNVLMEVSLC